MPSKRDSPSDDSDIDHVSPPRTFSKKFKTTPTTAEQHAAQSEKTTPTKSPKREGWSAEKRLRLFLAYESLAQIKWDEVAAKVGEGATAKSCKQQWQRAMGSKIRKALSEE